LTGLLLGELRTQRNRAICALIVTIDELRALLCALPVEAERTREQVKTHCEVEVELATACREFLRLDEALAAESRQLLWPPKPDRTN